MTITIPILSPGDVVGPGFFEEFLTAENTLRKPYGGAEQNMYNFAYTLYNLLYLKQSNQLKQHVLQTALRHMGDSKFIIMPFQKMMLLISSQKLYH